MKFVFLTSYFYPEVAGIAAHTTELANALIEDGHSVTVFTAIPFYPQWAVYPQYQRKLFKSENHNKSIVHRNWLYVPSQKKKITSTKRAIHEITFVAFQAFSLLFHFKAIKEADYTIIFSPPFLQGLNGLVLSRIMRKKIIFHVEDIQPDSALDLGMISKHRLGMIVIVILKWLEKYFYLASSQVSTLTQGMAEKLNARLPSHKNNVVLLPYWIDFGLFNINEEARNRFRRKIQLGDKRFLVGYAGNIGRKQNLEYLVQLAASNKIRDSVQFIVAGEGATRLEIEMLIRRKAIDNIIFLPFLHGQDYIDFLNGVDISYISQDINADKIFIPSKLYKTLACGSPVLCMASKRSELANIIYESKAGVVFEFEETDAVVEMINWLAISVNDINEMRANAFAFARKHFSRDLAVMNFYKIISSGIKKEAETR